jgi:hypothetical protein
VCRNFGTGCDLTLKKIPQKASFIAKCYISSFTIEKNDFNGNASEIKDVLTRAVRVAQW